MENLVVVGDSRDMREVADSSVQLIVTSPPYFNVKDYGKTRMRRVRVIDCVPDLKVWLNNHPRGKDPNAPLFLELRSKFNHLANHFGIRV